MIDNEIMVSIIIITYNHEKYIIEALDSALMQKTNFSYEIIVGEDFSTDNTRKILEQYEMDHPDIFKMVYRDKNMGPSRNLHDILMHANGKYIAMLEGDDYWTNPNKLQKQVDILEENQNFIGVVHSCDVFPHNTLESKKKKEMYRCNGKVVFTFEDFKTNRVPGHTCTLLYRNIYKNLNSNYDIIFKADLITGDRTIIMLLLSQGNLYRIDEEMSTYRLVKKAGATNINSQYLGRNMLYHNWIYENKLNDYCKLKFNKTFLTNEYIVKYWVNALIYRLSNGTAENKKILKKFNIIMLKRPALFFVLFRVFCKKCISKCISIARKEAC